MNELNKKNNNSTIIIVVCMMLSFICGVGGGYLYSISSTKVSEQVIKNITRSELVENSISSSVDNVYGATVVVMSYKSDKLISTGSGFVYKKDDKNAYIMTNYHVIDGADAVKVEFNDGNTLIDAKILGGEVYSDIAVLTIDSNKANSIVEIGKSDEVKLADTVFTVGSPMGKEYKGTVTKGILSGKDRLVEVNLTGGSSDYYMKVLQIDAAVNPGNSGGPLCDVSGNVIGIISLKIVQNEVEGMGFAIPIEDALNYANRIESGEDIVRPYIGISMVDISEEYYLWQQRITLPDGVDKGVVVIEVANNSPASKAGIKKGDVITKIGDVEFSSLAEFRYELYKYEVGDKVSITYNRAGKINSVEITLGKNS